MKRLRLCALWVLSCVMWATSVTAADAVIRGTITDQSGKPVRGAIVKAVDGPKALARYSQANGSYEIEVPPGKYQVSADAFGYQLKTLDADTAKSGALDFKLEPGSDFRRLTSAEARTILPNTREAQLVKGDCLNCHGTQTIVNFAGMTAEQWQQWLSVMTVRKFGNATGFDGRRGATVAKPLEKFFGADGMFSPQNLDKIDLSKVKHTPLSDKALRAKLKEYVVPTEGAMIHSLTVDAKRNIVWFSEYDITSNKIARFDPDTEKFTEYPVPVPGVLPHTGVVLNDGTFMVATAQYGIAAKLVSVDLKGNIKIYEYPEKAKLAGHTAVLSADGKTVWITAGPEVWAFDLKTEKFTSYQLPAPEQVPPGSHAALMGAARAPGEGEIMEAPRPQTGASDNRAATVTGPMAGRGPMPNSYDIGADSKGIVWITQLPYGIIVRLDPKTYEYKSYHTPEMRSARGIVVDTEDNVWWADYYGHQIGVLNQKTGEIKLYKTPTPESAPYGIVQDRRTGYIWYCDTEGNNVGRVDPKTGEITEYALPTRNAANRFLGVDAKGRAWYPGFFNNRIGMIDPNDGGATRTSSAR